MTATIDGCRSLRRQRGITQVELAGRLGWTQSAVSRFERQHDALLSTVLAYLAALDAALVIARNGGGPS